MPEKKSHAHDNEPEKAEAPNTEAGSDLEQQLTEAQQKAAEYLARWQRTQADFVNYKRRTEQERHEFASFANASLLTSILPVVDDLERALENVPDDICSHEWVEGVKLVARKLNSSLENCGVKQVLALGMEFDPNFHEALHQVPGPEGMVVSEFQKGYLLNEKLLRPARVMVGNGEEEPKEEEE